MLSLATAPVIGLGLVACSDTGGSDGAPSKPISVTIEERDGNVSTSADTVKASRHQEIMFIVSSDSADEFHVHSEPEHEFEVKAAKPRSSASPSTPAGQYPVESHELGITVLKLQIS